MADIEERLRQSNESLSGLLDLVPAKMYYAQDTSDQWKKRKQTKEQSQQAKRAKLDPDQPFTVREVEEAKERQRQEKAEKQKRRAEDAEKAKAGKDHDGAQAEHISKQTNAEKRKQKRHNKREMKVLEQERRKAKKEKGKGSTSEDSEKAQSQASTDDMKTSLATKVNGKSIKAKSTQAEISHQATSQPKPTTGNDEWEDADEEQEEEDEDEEEDADTSADIEISGIDRDDASNDDVDASMDEANDETDDIIPMPDLADGEDLTSPIHSTTSDPSSTSTAPTSIESATATSTEDKSTTKSTTKAPKDPALQQELRERLAKRIEELRAQRKGAGAQPRSRVELMEQRQKREEARKERKKQMRSQAKAEEAKIAAETKANSVQSKDIPKPVQPTNNFSYGAITFDDGEKTTSTLDDIKAAKGKRGPTDVAGKMKLLEAKKARLANMTDEKREGIAEKDRWSKALKQASGEKVQDNEALLKKSIKRQEVQKRKSEREWNERISGVAKAKYMKQKKRDDNLNARKEQKKLGKAGKKAKKPSSASKGGKKKSKGRAGFEGAGFGGGTKKK